VPSPVSVSGIVIGSVGSSGVVMRSCYDRDLVARPANLADPGQFSVGSVVGVAR